MRLVLPVFFLFFLLPGCKKTIEKQKENLIVEAMTDGKWKVASFTDDSSDLTSSFSGYSFQYYENRTVDAFQSGTLDKSGTWTEDIDNLNISANFAGVSNPLALINGTWHIEESDWVYVIASQGNKLMRLEKI